MKTKFLYLAFMTAVMAAACKPTPNKTMVEGVAEGVDTVYMEYKGKLDTVAVTDGKFKYELDIDTLAFVQVYDDDVFGYFIPDGSKVTLTLDRNLGTYRLASDNPKSPNSVFADFVVRFFEGRKKIYELGSLESAEEEANYNKCQQEYRESLRNFIKDNAHSSAAFVAFSLTGTLMDEDIPQIEASMSPTMLNSAPLSLFINSAKARITTAEGKPFLDFTVDDSDGKSVKFSDFVGKGKYVLVDFWASWCGPCRHEIPNIIKVYNKYKGENFDVLGVAVWDKPEDSKKAAKDLGINYSEIINAQEIPTTLYGIDGIPQIILFGPDGTILKKNLRGEEIEAEVAKYVKPVKK